MNFTKPMIDLAKEIRRRAPADMKPSIKMTNPELFMELGTLFHATNDAIIKALIKEICELAGEPWSAVLEDQTETPKATVMSYRGQTQHNPPGDSADQPAKPMNKTRIYRGQVVRS